jgi:pimeloyl-ACP methyl ester carboxylesterase
VVPGGEDKVAVVGHGIGLTKSASIAHARLLHDEGFTVVMFDHRNHALSGHDPSTQQLSDKFTRDVEATVRYAQEIRPEATTTVVWGFSFSSFPSFYVLGRDACRVDAVLCDSGPAEQLAPLFGGFIDAGALPVPRPFRRGRAREALVSRCAEVATQMLDAQWPPPVEVGTFATTPMLFLVGEDDPIVPATLVRDLAAHYPGARAEVVRGGHLNGMKTDPEGYGAHVRAFLAAVPAAR